MRMRCPTVKPLFLIGKNSEQQQGELPWGFDRYCSSFCCTVSSSKKILKENDMKRAKR